MAGIIELSMGPDHLGFGKMVEGTQMAKRKGTEECGAKPVCTKNTKMCQQEHDNYNDCVKYAMDTQVRIAQAQGQQRSGVFSSIPQWAIYAAVAIGAVIVIKRLRR